MNTDSNDHGIILVTGAGGFIGTHLCAELERAGISYVPMYRDRGSEDAKNITGDSSMAGRYSGQAVYADLTKAVAIPVIPQGISTVIHLAGYAHVDVDSDSESRAVNELGTENLLKICIANKVSRFVYVSSVLAEAEENGSDHTAYGASKLRAEQRVRELCAASDTDYVIVRPASVYGPGMAGNLAGMIWRIANNRLPPLPVKTASMSLIGVRDLCHILIATSKLANAGNYSVTVTDGREYSLKGLETSIENGLGRKSKAWTTPHVLLYATFFLRDMLSLGRGRKGRRYWQKLTQNSLYTNQSMEKLHYQPKDSFETSLGDILESMNLATIK